MENPRAQFYMQQAELAIKYNFKKFQVFQHKSPVEIGKLFSASKAKSANQIDPQRGTMTRRVVRLSLAFIRTFEY
jgi:hypothetical protein